MTDQKPSWYILGAGAMGCLWAAYWRLSDFPITLITPTPRSSSFLELARRTSTNREETQRIKIRTITLEELAQSSLRIDHLLVATKAQHTRDAITKIKGNIAPQATVLILQNGMGSKELPQLLPSQYLVTAITTDGAYRTDKLSVVHAGKGHTHIGADPHFLNLLPSDYLELSSCTNIDFRQWEKLTLNCAINGLTVIHHCKNGELLKIPQARKQLAAVCQEIATITDALGLSFVVNGLIEQVENTLKNTSDNYSSMYQDINNGRTTEIDYINGYLVAEANKLGISCPVNQAIINDIKQRERMAK